MKLLMSIMIITAVFLSGCDVQQNIADRSSITNGSVGQLAPKIAGTNLDNQPTRSQDFAGHPLVVDFWASWCGPCHAEQNEINSLANHYESKGVNFIGVVMRDDPAQAKAYQEQLHVPYQSINDSDGSIAANFDVVAPPTIIVVDEKGHVAGNFLGTTAGIGSLLSKL